MVHRTFINKLRNFNPQGFTLVELLIAISVLMIVMTVTVLLINPDRIRTDANETKSLSEMGILRNSLELYHNDNNAYPNALGALLGEYINDDSLLKDHKDVGYCYLRKLELDGLDEVVVSYKLCVQTQRDDESVLSDEYEGGNYNDDECNYDDARNVICLRSPI